MERARLWVFVRRIHLIWSDLIFSYYSDSCDPLIYLSPNSNFTHNWYDPHLSPIFENCHSRMRNAPRLNWWVEGKNYRKIPYFMGKFMVSCRFSLKSTHWTSPHVRPWGLTGTSFTASFRWRVKSEASHFGTATIGLLADFAGDALTWLDQQTSLVWTGYIYWWTFWERHNVTKRRNLQWIACQVKSILWNGETWWNAPDQVVASIWAVGT